MMFCRHPGQYFLTGGESQDFLVNNAVSRKQIYQSSKNNIAKSFTCVGCFFNLCRFVTPMYLYLYLYLCVQVCNTEVTPEEMKLGVARGGAVSHIFPFHFSIWCKISLTASRWKNAKTDTSYAFINQICLSIYISQGERAGW